MQRPVMNPSFLDDAPQIAHGDRLSARWLRAIRGGVGLLFTDVLRGMRSQSVNARPWYSRLLRSVFYRMMFVPVLLAIVVSVLVATGTHPHAGDAISDPTSQGAYYDPVELLSADQTKLEAWLVPVVDARRVLVEREEVLHKRYPAVVLVHDFGASRQQMLPIITPLHDAGYVLLVLNLRGTGPSAKVGSTFGINEAQDVRAAVELLRRRPFVDPDAIGVLGVGTGATACLLAAQQDPALKTMIVDHPVRQFDDLLLERIGPRHPWLAWVRPFCKWGFELSYKVDADEVNLDRFASLMKQRNCLLLDDPAEPCSFTRPVRQQQVVEFLKKHLTAKPRTAQLLRRDEFGRVEYAPADRDGDGAPDAPATGGESWPPQRSALETLPKANRSPL